MSHKYFTNSRDEPLGCWEHLENLWIIFWVIVLLFMCVLAPILLAIE